MFTNEQRTDLLVTALEGGSNYWYWLDKEADYIVNKHRIDGNSYAENMIVALNSGEQIPFHDCESMDFLGFLTKESIESGEKLMQQKYNWHFANIVYEQWDCETADVWLQLCIMDEIVFG